MWLYYKICSNSSSTSCTLRIYIFSQLLILITTKILMLIVKNFSGKKGMHVPYRNSKLTRLLQVRLALPRLALPRLASRCLACVLLFAVSYPMFLSCSS